MFYFEPLVAPCDISVVHDYIKVGKAQIPIIVARDIFNFLLTRPELSLEHLKNYDYQRNGNYSVVVQCRNHCPVTFGATE